MGYHRKSAYRLLICTMLVFSSFPCGCELEWTEVDGTTSVDYEFTVDIAAPSSLLGYKSYKFSKSFEMAYDGSPPGAWGYGGRAALKDPYCSQSMRSFILQIEEQGIACSITLSWPTLPARYAYGEQPLDPRHFRPEQSAPEGSAVPQCSLRNLPHRLWLSKASYQAVILPKQPHLVEYKDYQPFQDQPNIHCLGDRDGLPGKLTLEFDYFQEPTQERAAGAITDALSVLALDQPASPAVDRPSKPEKVTIVITHRYLSTTHYEKKVAVAPEQ